jgi:hypothetical protein
MVVPFRHSCHSGSDTKSDLRSVRPLVQQLPLVALYWKSSSIPLTPIFEGEEGGDVLAAGGVLDTTLEYERGEGIERFNMLKTR